ncbi:hypothetical protein VMCG_09467 [Cytospora schulzeri]|uniref:Alpha-1,2-mannosyltransferase n=1 Tax=Cytospora schulzeri TaxID=448051 RepID=A0A423VKQ7_9PEZI|nr:hypothetical protein VMCG_09467 [Valsa malicola]
MAIDYLLFAGSRPLPYAACVLILALLGLGVHLARRKTASSPKDASGTVEKHPWVLQFPPSRRHTLADLKLKGTSAPYTTPAPDVLRRRAVPSSRTADWDRDGLFTPTGFSTQDIRALGRFPDYSVLTGVPHPQPYGSQFDIKTAIFRPFRPFRWNYHQTMAHYKFDPDWWVELDKSYHSIMAQRQELIKKYGELVYFTDPGSELACRELMEMLVQFICRRYPQCFSLENDHTILINRLLNTRTDLTSTPPLKVISENIPEDYAMVFRNEDDGFYYLRAAMVCSSVGWDIGMNRGKQLRRIHDHVPDYAEKMAFSMDRFFAKMGVDQPIQRCSWSLEDHAPLFSSPRMTENWERSAFAERKEELTVEHIKLRCDYQTLRRLPLSGAVVFNFKAVFTPITELREEPFVPAILAKVLEEGKKNLIDYKTVDHVKDVTIEACKVWAQEQVDKGIVPADWEVGTLKESPFFPGWEEKWHAQQGF